MDFNFLVENGFYKKEMLTEEQKTYISGMEYALLEVETCVMNNYNEEDEETTLDKIKREIVIEALEEIKDYVKGSINAAIVIYADNNEIQKSEG